MGSPRRWAVAGALVGAALALPLFAPASWLSAGLASASGQHLLLLEPRGSLWNGSARLVLAAGSGSAEGRELPERLHWRLRPAWLDSAPGLRLTLRQDGAIAGETALALRLAPGQMRLSLPDAPTLLQWPAAWLAGLGTPWNTLAPQGQLRLQTQGFALDWQQGRWQVQGLLRLELLNFSSRLSPLSPLGSYRLDMQGGPVTQLQLQTLEGALRLSGQGSVGTRTRFEGEASAAAGSETALANLLNIIGRRRGARSIISLG